jgi:phosphoheptose isomerase
VKLKHNKIVKNYVTQLNVVLNDKLLNKELTESANLISKCIRQNGCVYVAGNGGSAAISNHLLCDFSKGIQEKTNYSPMVVSLSNSVELITAISNDSDFSNIFVNQVVNRLNPSDVCILISSSGKSKNIVKLANYLIKKKVDFVSIIGFDGGSKPLRAANFSMHIVSNNYGVIEDASQAIMHILAKLIIEELNEEV